MGYNNTKMKSDIMHTVSNSSKLTFYATFQEADASYVCLVKM